MNKHQVQTERPRREKCDAEVKLHLPESLRDALVCAAVQECRSVSEFVRHELSINPKISIHRQGSPVAGRKGRAAAGNLRGAKPDPVLAKKLNEGFH